MKIFNYEDPEVINEINSFINNHYEFKNFHDFHLNDGTVQLIISEKRPENKAKKYVPSYLFDVYVNDIRVGEKI